MSSKKPQKVVGIPTNRPTVNNDTASVVQVTATDFIGASTKALKEYQLIPFRSQASSTGRDQFANIDGNISVRNQFTRSDYEFFRAAEGEPRESKDIIRSCRQAYRKVGIIRNVIDLMSDFGAQGIQLTHPNARIQKFYRGWFKRVRGPSVSERFLNLFYREGVCVTKRTMGRISFNDEERMRALASDDQVLEPDDVRLDQDLKTKKRNIPLRYNFLNPLTLEVIGGDELAQFVGKNMFALRVSNKLRNLVQSPKNIAEQKLVEMLPAELRTAISRGDTLIPLDERKVRAFFYKKDDWQTWADPMIYAILNDLVLLEKMKLADLAALDGAISQIRLWKLGDLEKGIFPTEAAVQRLADVLMSNPGGGAFDLIWGPELSLEEYKTNVHQFLGKSKYEPIRQSIYEGLGIPPTLTGSAGGGGFSNNYVSLKTLVQRLEYGRAALREFWEQEIELVRQAMGFQRPAQVTFDRMILTDEAAEKALLIQLVDRDLISFETLVERFGECAEVEELKMRREARARESKALNQKAGPYHSPQQTFDLLKIALQAGYITPEQAGVEIPMDLADQEAPFMTQMKSSEKVASMRKQSGPMAKAKPKGVAGQGRPLNSKDGGKRKSRTVKPLGSKASVDIDRTAAFMTSMIWTKAAQQQIAEIVNPALLNQFGKTSMRAISDEQAKLAEDIKFAVLCNHVPYCEISEETVYAVLQSGATLPSAYNRLYNEFYASAIEKYKREPTVDELRTIQASVYAVFNADEELLNNG